MATTNAQSLVRTLEGVSRRQTPMLRRPPALRPIAPAPAPQARIVYRPKTSMPGGLKMPSKDKGFFANVGNIIAMPGAVIKGLPTFAGKLAQTAAGFAEGAYDFTLDLASEIAGSKKEFYTSRFETDLAKARKLGLKGTDLIAYAAQRQYPLGADFIRSGTVTAGDIGELATLGRKDFGEPGFNLYQAYKRGELPQRLLLEDVGNLMLAGRALGLGNVAARAGKLATEAGATRLGTAVRRTGYLSEQPIAATVRGVARLAGRALPETPGRLGRIAGISERVSLSERPLRALLEENVANRRAIYTGRLAELDRELFDVNEQVSAMRQRGEEIPEQLAAKQETLERQRKAAFQATGVPKLARQTTKRLNERAEATQNLHVQALASFGEKGPVQQSPRRLRAAAQQARKEAQRSGDPTAAQQLNGIADQVDKFADAKESDTTNRMNERQYIDDSMSANILINTGMIDPIKRNVDEGTITFDEAVALLISDEVSTLLADQGYKPSPSAVQRALDYIDGRADLIDQVGIEAAQNVTGRFSDYMEAMRQAGEGQVRGAASPFETGNSPLPEYFFNELQSPSRKVINSFLRDYVGNIIEYALSIYEQMNPNIRREMGVQGVPPGRLLEVLQDSPKDSQGYALAYMSVRQAFDEFMGQPDTRFSSFPEELTPERITTIRNFFRDPLIYPAKARGMISVERRLLRFARGRDVETFASGLKQFVADFPDLLIPELRQVETTLSRVTRDIESRTSSGNPVPEQLRKQNANLEKRRESLISRRDEIVSIADRALVDTARFDQKTWEKLRSELQKLENRLNKSLQELTQEAGALDARRQNALVRINELRTTLQMAQQYVEELVANPEQFFPTETPEVARLRGVAAETRTALEQMGEVSRLPAIDTYQQRVSLDEEIRTAARERANAERELAGVQSELAAASARQRVAQEITWEDEGAIQAELETARSIRDQYGLEAEVSLDEARQAKNSEITQLETTRQGILNRLPPSLGRFRRSDLTGKRPRFVPQLGYRNVSEDLNASIDAGTVGRPEVRKEFLRRFTETKETESTQAWDEWSDSYARINNIEDINLALEDAARTFTQLYDIERQLAATRTSNIESYRERLLAERKDQISSDLDRAYEDAGVRPPEALIQLLGDYENPQVIGGRISELTSRANNLQSRIDAINSQIRTKENEIQRLVRTEQESIPTARLAEQARLRGIEQEATVRAEQLVSENLAAQQAGVKARLRGVGKVVEGRGVLQRQFEGPAQAEEARLLDQQAKDAQVVEQKRAEFAAQDQARTQAQGIVAEATATARQLEQPVGPALLGEGRRLQYIPFGPSAFVEQVSTVSKRPGTEGAAPEMVGSYEKMRTSSIVALSPSQVTARIKETLQALGRNVTMGKILTDRNFVSSVAEIIPQEVRDALMRDAEALNPPTVGVDTKIRANKVKADYQRLLSKELDRRGLEVVSPVEFPDPTDPFAARQAVGALKEPVRAQDIEDNSIVMTKGLREIIGTEFEQVPSTRVPQSIQRRFQQLQRLTGNWKSVILPFSIRWQIGDAVGNVINAWVRGDIPPNELWKYMTDAYDMLRESQLTPEGQPTRLRNIMFGEELGGYTGDPLLQIMQSLGLQSSGGNMADTMAMLRDTGSPMVDYITGSKPARTPVGRAFTQFQRSAFAFNEFQNRLLRQAVALKNLDEYLQSKDMTFDSVTYDTVARDPNLQQAIVDAVSEANRILGNFSDLTPYERQVVRTIFPFWSWMKFINKAAAQLVLDQPDRVLFMSHLASATMEPDAEGLWEFLQGKTRIMGGLYDLSFLNPYSDAMIFSGKNFNQMLANFIAESESISPAFTLPLYGVGEAFYQARGGQPFLFPTFSRPSYLEGRPGETTRTLGDTLGGLAYYGLRQFGGPARNILEALPVSGTIPGTDIAYGFSGVPRFPQGSLRTTGRYATPLLTPEQGRLSAVMRTFGLPARLADVGRAEQIARQGVRAGRQTRLRRVTERRLAERKMR